MKKNNKIKVVVAMSGGVDSSVAAALLKRAGFNVVGIMMKFWKEGESAENRCCSTDSERMARLVAKKIGIPFYGINVEKEFKKKVVDYFLKEYKNGNTPNPCVVCNKEIKFGFLLKKALSLGADFVATGHYAQNTLAPLSGARLFVARDKEKDQSYFLWQLNQRQLKHILFPVGQYTKSQVRKLAKKFGLPTAEAPESQEVCFIPASSAGRQNSTNNFLKKYLKANPGKIIDISGKILGRHRGLWFYTIGQRRGLEIPQTSDKSKPYYVVEKDFKKNILFVSQNQKDLLKKEFIAKDINWMSAQKLPTNAEVKIRYKSDLAKARIFKLKGSKVKIVFTKPQKAITPGQSVVFYKGRQLLGGGTIDKYIEWVYNK